MNATAELNNALDRLKTAPAHERGIILASLPALFASQESEPVRQRPKVLNASDEAALAAVRAEMREPEIRSNPLAMSRLAKLAKRLRGF